MFHFELSSITLQRRRENYTVDFHTKQSMETRHGSDVVLWESVRRSRDRWWCRLLWAVWGIPACSSLIKVQRWTASIIEMSCFHQQLLSAIRDLSGDFFTFQQDNAAALRARETVQLLTCETPDFIAPALWPANSPDLNPVDYHTWGKHRRSSRFVWSLVGCRLWRCRCIDVVRFVRCFWHCRSCHLVSAVTAELWTRRLSSGVVLVIPPWAFIGSAWGPQIVVCSSHLRSPTSLSPGSHTVYYRQDAAKRQTAGIKFTHRPKFFAPQGRLVAPIHVKLGRADGHVGPLGYAKFHLNRRRGWECGPKISKMSTFW